MTTDPFARTPLDISVGGVFVVRVPWHPAADWVSALSTPTGPVAVLIALTGPEDGDRIVNAVLDGEVTSTEAATAAYDLLTQAAPYKWWKTLRLAVLTTRPTVLGQLTLAGLDPYTLTLSQWVCAAYAMVTRNSDVKDRFKTDVAFDDPPPGIVDDDWMSDADFNAMVASTRMVPDRK